MKKIDFNELSRLISNIDYLNSDSYPIIFSIINKETDNIETFEAGIGNWEGADNDIIIDTLIDKAFGTQRELQYIARIDNMGEDTETICYLDLQDSDCIEANEIDDMLKEKCHLSEYNLGKLIIILHQTNSFNGIEESIFDHQLSELVVDDLKKLSN